MHGVAGSEQSPFWMHEGPSASADASSGCPSAGEPSAPGPIDWSGKASGESLPACAASGGAPASIAWVVASLPPSSLAGPDVVKSPRMLAQPDRHMAIKT